MKSLKLITDKINIDGKTIVYGRRIIKYSPKNSKTAHEKYLEGNIDQFYDFMCPDKKEE